MLVSYWAGLCSVLLSNAGRSEALGYIVRSGRNTEKYLVPVIPRVFVEKYFIILKSTTLFFTL